MYKLLPFSLFNVPPLTVISMFPAYPGFDSTPTAEPVWSIPFPLYTQFFFSPVALTTALFITNFPALTLIPSSALMFASLIFHTACPAL